MNPLDRIKELEAEAERLRTALYNVLQQSIYRRGPNSLKAIQDEAAALAKVEALLEEHHHAG